jgi:hypothetical protein
VSFLCASKPVADYSTPSGRHNDSADSPRGAGGGGLIGGAEGI